jgi:predicted MFS family arabinose efflux permease
MTADAPEQARGLTSRVIGASIDAELRPVLGVSLLQAIAESAQASYLGLWALRALGSSQSELGLTFAAAAIAAVIAGNVGGQISDRVGRRRPLLVASAALAALGASLAFVGTHVLLGLGLIVCLGAASGVIFALQQAVLTDIVPQPRHEHAFSSQRVVQNLGYMAGPLLGAALLTVGWGALFVGIGVVGAVAFAVALGAIPRDGPVVQEAPAEGSTLLVLLRDPGFALLMAAGTLAAMVYLSYETLLPISLVQSHGVAPSVWGILLALNPIVVVLCQIRLTARVGRVPELARIVVGIAAMGLPFLLVEVSTAVPLLVLMLLLFVLGEMLWGPPSQSLIARLAPDEMRGAYFGASSAMWPAAFALGPFLGLQVRGALGDTAMWCSIAITGAIASALYATVAQIARRDAGSARRPTSSTV